jgi:L-ribulose-5-phosphate 3-epimerase
MNPIPIAIVGECTGLPVRQALLAAARAGASGVQFDAAGELAPDALGDTARRELRTLLRSYDLHLAALNVPLRRGLDSAEHQQQRIEHVRNAMRLSVDLGARRVVVPMPKLPTEATEPRANLMRDALDALAAFGDKTGCAVAPELGYDPADKVAAYFATFARGSLKATFDPANFLLHGHDPLAQLPPLTGKLAQVLARDARSAGVSRGLEEVALGAGDLDWMALTATLQVLEFDGFLTVKREQGETKLADVTSGVTFLKRFVVPLG